MLEVTDVVKRYESGSEVIQALDHVSMTVEAGEVVALYGPSGSGKTTLLGVVAALLAPDSGSVRVAGREIVGLSRREIADYRRLEVGYVSQTLDLLPGVPAIDNAALKLLGGRRIRDVHGQIAPLMERLGLADRLRHRPHQLSAGERQRVLIARALATGPRLVLADEPTGSLDTRRGREILTLLTEICRERGTAVLLVTHDAQAAAIASRAHTLRDGALVTYQPDQDLLRAGQ